MTCDGEENAELAAFFDDLFEGFEAVVAPRFALTGRLGGENVVGLVDDEVQITLPARVGFLLVIVELFAQDHRDDLAHREIDIAQ
ncbi:hypothetical protein BK799_29675 [Rhodococcus sp. D-1]|nr:hypothetical protein BK799_29675 [Rhodococcus sp. D-1]